jgi:probable HAF family extracellular repeat protein
MKSRFLLSFAAVTLFAALAIPVRLAAQKQIRYSVTDLGTLGGTFSTAQGISEDGWVEGWSLLPGDQTQRSFLWVGGLKIDLGTLGGPNSGGDQGGHFRPNERGQVPGFGQTTTLDPESLACAFPGPLLICLPFIWQEGMKTTLPTLGGYVAQATDLNKGGESIGEAQNTILDSTCLPFTYQQNKPVIWKKGKIQELPTISGDPDGQGFGINDHGQVVGATGNCFNLFHAVLWQNDTVIDLGRLGGTNSTFEVAFGINNLGQVVGRSDLPGDTTFHAFLWQDGVMNDLGTLPGYFSSEGQSINDKGQVVGQSCTVDFSNCSAILLENGGMIDLNSLVATNSPLYLLEGLDINSQGQIVGFAFQQSTGEVHGYLANPCDEQRSDKAGCEDGSEGTSTVSARSERAKVTLPENVRNLLRQQKARRNYIPGQPAAPSN